MIKSMTGYGSSRDIQAGFDISVELKSVNNRYLDANVRMPRNFIFAEDSIKKCIQKHINRGKVDVFINIVAKDSDDLSVSVNETLLKSYLTALKLIAKDFDAQDDISAINVAKFPDVLTVIKNDVDSDEITSGICSVVEDALADFDNMRIREGNKLEDDILANLSNIETLLSEIEAKSQETVLYYKDKLEQKIREVLDSKDIDDSRIVQEVAIFADHIATDEETVRLRSHIEQLKKMLEEGSPIGKKIDFLLQEFNRESNTIGSKCQNSEIAHIVVDLKSNIEKIREQVQNIE